MIKNGKFFVSSDSDGRDFKALFRHLASTGAGRPVDANGFPQGSWTPDLLADAISQIDANRSGIELRTVQLWFQDNAKGISAENIRWLARIFGCDDPQATSKWQAELSAAQSRLVAKRKRQGGSAEPGAQYPPDAEQQATFDSREAPLVRSERRKAIDEPKSRISLAGRSEALFGTGSPLDLPASVFAGAVALGFLSYFLGVHSVTYAREDGVIKQVGFLWAPNWTVLFMVFMPLFYAFAVELLVFWKKEGRSKLLAASGGTDSDTGWTHKVEASSYTYWAVFLICLGFAGLFQWISVRLIPLIEGGGDYAIDWGSMAIARPEVISVPQAAAFTGFAYLYMCLCFYLFFVGLILLYTMAHDFWQILETVEPRLADSFRREASETLQRLIRGIFRCTVLGILVAYCMKLQTFYLTTDAKDILDWLVRDSLSILIETDDPADQEIYRSPTHYTSLLIVMAACVVFLNALVRIGIRNRFDARLDVMTAAVILLIAGYLLIGAFAGSSIVLAVAILLAIYGLFDPGFGTQRSIGLGNGRNVL